MYFASPSPSPNVSNILSQGFVSSSLFLLLPSPLVCLSLLAHSRRRRWISRNQSRIKTDNSFKLAHHILSKPSNIVFSPISIHVLLGMIAAGSNNPTRDQIVGFVTSTSSEEFSAFFSEIVTPSLADGGPLGGPVLSAANGLWVDLSLNLKPAFQKLLQKAYGAVSKHVDIMNKPKEVIDEVNMWGSKETKGLIKNILPPDALDAASSLERKRNRNENEKTVATGLIIANAVYFKGKWDLRHKFHAELTQEHDFYLLDGSSVQAPLMSSKNTHQYFGAFDGFKVLRLPYAHGKDSRRFSLCIYLPDAKDGLPDLRERVCMQSGFIDNHFPDNRESLEKYRVPKFKFDFHFEATDVLKGMGLVLPFEDGQLTEMVDPIFPVEVSRMFHKAFIEVNEEGTEAAAASAYMVGGGRPISRPEFVADHPFLFVIREDTKGTVLFIGQLLNPLA